MGEIMKGLLDGYFDTALITVLAAIVPLGVGGYLTVLASKNGGFGKALGWISLLTECLSPALIVLITFYAPGFLLGSPLFSRLTSAIIGISIAFIFHMPARYMPEYSLKKNLIYNGLDLLSSLIKWSAISRVLMIEDVVRVAENYAGYGLIYPMFIALAMVALPLLVLESGKRIVKDKMN